MRIEDAVVIRGSFWISSKQEYRFPGKLTITDGAAIKLELPKYPGLDVHLIRALNGEPEMRPIEAIEGKSNRKEFLRLQTCFYRKADLMFGELHVTAKTAIIGGEDAIHKKLKARNAKFSIEGLEDWVRPDGIKHKKETCPRGKTIYSAVYAEPDEITFRLQDPPLKLSITPGFNPCISWRAGRVGFREYTLRSTLEINLQAEAELEISSFYTVAYSMVVLLSTIFGERISLKGPILYSLVDPGRPSKVYNLTPFHSSTHPKTGNPLFTISSLLQTPTPDASLQKWVSDVQKAWPVYWHFLAALSKEMPSERLLDLSRSLETLGGSHYQSGSKPRLKKVLKEILGVFQWLKEEPLDSERNNGFKEEDFIDKIVDARNTVAHPPLLGSLNGDGLSQGDYELLNLRLFLLLQLHHLKCLGFPQNRIKELARSSVYYRELVKFKKTKSSSEKRTPAKES